MHRAVHLGLLALGWTVFAVGWSLRPGSPTKPPTHACVGLLGGGLLLAAVAHSTGVSGVQLPGVVLMAYSWVCYGVGWSFYRAPAWASALWFEAFWCLLVAGVLVQCVTRARMHSLDPAPKSVLQSVAYNLMEGGDLLGSSRSWDANEL